MKRMTWNLWPGSAEACKGSPYMAVLLKLSIGVSRSKLMRKTEQVSFSVHDIQYLFCFSFYSFLVYYIPTTASSPSPPPSLSLQLFSSSSSCPLCLHLEESRPPREINRHWIICDKTRCTPSYLGWKRDHPSRKKRELEVDKEVASHLHSPY